MVATPLASRVSRKLTRECAPPRVKELPREQVHLLLRPSPPLLFLLFSRLPCRTVPHTAANPPYAPSGSYLRVLLIFSYYRRGHVGTFHSHTREPGLVCTQGTVHLEVYQSPLASARTQRRSPLLLSPIYHLLPLVSVLLSGTPICEHIITETQGGEEREDDAGVSLREGAKTR